MVFCPCYYLLLIFKIMLSVKFIVMYITKTYVNEKDN